MMKLKNLILLVCLAGCFAACSKKDNFDAEAQFTADTTAIRAYIVKNNIPAIKHPTGVFYQIINPGTGNVSYTNSTDIYVTYVGKFLDGQVFDSSKGDPFRFSLPQVIQGWQIGVPLIQKGGKIRLLIPSFYAYGNSSTQIPANSILDFDISVTDLK